MVELFRFSAVVVVGDENGHVGVRKRKSSRSSDAIKKLFKMLKRT